jgi:ABC-type antimicrobial peptide transport system permease subunit
MGISKNYRGEEDKWSTKMVVLSEKEVKEVLGIELEVVKGHVITSKAFKEIYPWCREGDYLKLRNNKNGNLYEFIVQSEIYGTLINSNNYAIILEEEDYNNILKSIQSSDKGTFNLLRFQDWKKTGDIFRELTKKIEDINGVLSNNQEKTYGSILKSASKAVDYEASERENTTYLFVTLFMGIIFIISTGVVLYFKIFTDLDEGKARYKKLFKIGITNEEMKRIISKELSLIYFVPVVLGSIIGYSYIAICTINFKFYEKILLNSLKVTIVYFLVHYIFYLITRKKYFEKIIHFYN